MKGRVGGSTREANFTGLRQGVGHLDGRAHPLPGGVAWRGAVQRGVADGLVKGKANTEGSR